MRTGPLALRIVSAHMANSPTLHTEPARPSSHAPYTLCTRIAHNTHALARSLRTSGGCLHGCLSRNTRSRGHAGNSTLTSQTAPQHGTVPRIIVHARRLDAAPSVGLSERQSAAALSLSYTLFALYARCRLATHLAALALHARGWLASAAERAAVRPMPPSRDGARCAAAAAPAPEHQSTRAAEHAPEHQSSRAAAPPPSASLRCRRRRRLGAPHAFSTPPARSLSTQRHHGCGS